MARLFALVLFVLEILGVVDCFKSRLPGEKKALWIILILFVPVVGLILYYLLGRSSQSQPS